MSEFYVGRWHSPEGHVVAVVKRGVSSVHLVCASLPVTRKVTLSMRDERSIVELDYPLRRAAKSLLKFGNKYGITGGAKALLKEAIEDQTPRYYQDPGRLPPE